MEKLIVKNYRGFDDFQLPDLGRVNLLVGANNCGKTSLLEAIQLLVSIEDLSALYSIMSRRGEIVESAESHGRLSRGERYRMLDGRHLFFGHAIGLGSWFEIASDDERMRAVVDSEPSETKQSRLFREHPDFYAALVIDWKGLGHPPEKVVIPMASDGTLTVPRFSSRPENGRSNRAPASFVTTDSLSSEEVAAHFDRLVLTPKERLVEEALRIVEERVERIATTKIDFDPYVRTRRGVMLKLHGQPNRIPLGSLGDGMWRLLGLALALANSEKGILLVDEIDTGLHYSVMEDMWRLVYQTARELDVQVFATTHSRDCVESLAAVASTTQHHEREIRIHRIDREHSRAVVFNEREIVIAAERGIEVR